MNELQQTLLIGIEYTTKLIIDKMLINSITVEGLKEFRKELIKEYEEKFGKNTNNNQIQNDVVHYIY